MVYVFFADGFEESEALVTVDMLRRGGLTVKMCAVGNSLCVTGAHGITVTCDIKLGDTDCADAKMLVLPGGMPGVTNLSKSNKLRAIFARGANNGAVLGAICAAPSLLGKWGLLENKKAVCYPGFESELTGATYTDAPVVTDGKVITSKAAGTVYEFAFALLDAVGADSKEVASSVFYKV